MDAREMNDQTGISACRKGVVMTSERHYQIEYILKGTSKSFYVRAGAMNNEEAWHWATVDAGFGEIPKYRREPVIKLCKPKAERFGITEVRWKDA
jgi:hypothetical protein